MENNEQREICYHNLWTNGPLRQVHWRFLRKIMSLSDFMSNAKLDEWNAYNFRDRNGRVSDPRELFVPLIHVLLILYVQYLQENYY